MRGLRYIKTSLLVCKTFKMSNIFLFPGLALAMNTDEITISYNNQPCKEVQ